MHVVVVSFQKLLFIGRNSRALAHPSPLPLKVVEVLHFMGGEDSPLRVLCPWRAHRLASTLPAVARATAVCFLRCECLRGRGVSRLRDPSHRWGARCSSHGCPAFFRGSQQVPQRRTDALFSRLSRPDVRDRTGLPFELPRQAPPPAAQEGTSPVVIDRVGLEQRG